MTHVQDVTRGILSALRRTERPGPSCEIVNLGSGRAVTLEQVVRLVEVAAGRPVRLLLRDPDPADVALTLADLTVARRTLGYEPRVPIEQGIQDVVEWCEARYEGECRAAS